MRSLTVDVETWPLKGSGFTISRGTRTEITVVTASIAEGDLVGRGECFPHSRYGETVESVAEQVASVTEKIAAGLSRTALLDALSHGAARNAVDCALWDLEIKQGRRERPDLRVWTEAGLNGFDPIQSVMTLSLSEPDAMAQAAQTAVSDGYSKIKVKLGSSDGRDDERIAAVRLAAPDVSLVVDANEGWRASDLPRLLDAMHAANVSMVEQPLPDGDDEALRDLNAGVPIGADESFHTRADLDAMTGKYDVVNIKLDKAGGLTEGLAAALEAKRRGFDVMVGCMLGTSLAMAPAAVVAQHASYIDLDGPLWLQNDRPHGLTFDKGMISDIDRNLWG